MSTVTPPHAGPLTTFVSAPNVWGGSGLAESPWKPSPTHATSVLIVDYVSPVGEVATPEARRMSLAVYRASVGITEALARRTVSHPDLDGQYVTMPPVDRFSVRARVQQVYIGQPVIIVDADLLASPVLFDTE